MNDKENSTEVFEDVFNFIITFAMEISLRCLLKVLSEHKEVCENVYLYIKITDNKGYYYG